MKSLRSEVKLRKADCQERKEGKKERRKGEKQRRKDGKKERRKDGRMDGRANRHYYLSSRIQVECGEAKERRAHLDDTAPPNWQTQI